MKGFGALLHKDIALLCSDDNGIKGNLVALQWTNFLSFMKSKTPTVLIKHTSKLHEKESMVKSRHHHWSNYIYLVQASAMVLVHLPKGCLSNIVHWACIKLVMDNIDSTVRPRFMREDAQNQSLHYVQVYAVKDRINNSSIPDPPPSSTRNIFNIIPSSDDYAQLKKNLPILVARILVKNIQFFNEDYRQLVTKHIPHKYSDQTSQKSEVVNSVSYIHAHIFLLAV